MFLFQDCETGADVATALIEAGHARRPPPPPPSAAAPGAAKRGHAREYVPG